MRRRSHRLERNRQPRVGFNDAHGRDMNAYMRYVTADEFLLARVSRIASGHCFGRALPNIERPGP
ncbi:Hypothetical protein BIBO2_0281 [Brucella sp. BO2]|nr:Hypothetical protein BIBO2_0281 [Brucella sp. BO2]